MTAAASRADIAARPAVTNTAAPLLACAVARPVP